jgi:hypothetical protein
MGFNPLKEKGISLEKQTRNWTQLNTSSLRKDRIHPYTRARLILMNCIETDGIIFSHQFARHVDDIYLKRQLAQTRRLEQQQQKSINWLLPFDETPVERAIAYEQTEVELAAAFALSESNPYIKHAYDFSLIEDFDHLYRFANLLDLLDGRKPDEIVQKLTEIMPGRPVKAQHRHPYDDIRKAVDFGAIEGTSLLHIITMAACEMQTMNYYMNAGNQIVDYAGRGLFQEIAQVEEAHLSQFVSLSDPSLSWCEKLVLREYNECYMYYSFLQQEDDPNVRKIWDLHLHMEIEHLKMTADLLKRREGKRADEILPKDIPEIVLLQSNIEYIRNILRAETDTTTEGTDFITMERLPENARYFQYQKTINGDGFIPSERIVENRVEARGEDYRQEIAGIHPVERFRTREKVIR